MFQGTEVFHNLLFIFRQIQVVSQISQQSQAQICPKSSIPATMPNWLETEVTTNRALCGIVFKNQQWLRCEANRSWRQENGQGTHTVNHFQPQVQKTSLQERDQGCFLQEKTSSPLLSWAPKEGKYYVDKNENQLLHLPCVSFFSDLGSQVRIIVCQDSEQDQEQSSTLLPYLFSLTFLFHTSSRELRRVCMVPLLLWSSQ